MLLTVANPAEETSEDRREPTEQIVMMRKSFGTKARNAKSGEKT